MSGRRTARGERASQPAISVVVAAYDEEPAIGAVVRAALAAASGVEVVVADDGSRDHTAEAARAAGAHVVRLEVNRGKGQAVRRGLDAARGEVVVLIDGDGQDDPTDLPALVAALEAGADLAIGSRFLGRFGPDAITPLNRAGNQFLTFVINLLYGVRLTDTQAGFKALRRSLVTELGLTANRYDIEVDLLLGVLARGGCVVEVPVRREARRHGRSGFNRIFDGTRILLRILAKRYTRLV
jgi:glycosyltransferase involved in cell wall biosynthesis